MQVGNGYFNTHDRTYSIIVAFALPGVKWTVLCDGKYYNDKGSRALKGYYYLDHDFWDDRNYFHFLPASDTKPPKSDDATSGW